MFHGPKSWRLLLRAIANALPGMEAGVPALRVFECDHNADGDFSQLAGLQAARIAVLAEANLGGAVAPVLVVGLHANLAPLFDRCGAGESGAASLLTWPGAAYLQYGFTPRELQDAWERAVQGAVLPFSPGIVTRDDVLRASSNVRHWLEGRLLYVGASLLDFGSAARGELHLVPAYLAPKEAISEQHQQMLDRLWDLSSAVSTHAPGSDGLTLIRQAMDRFEATWASLEVARAEYRLHLRAADNPQMSHLAVRVCEEIQSAMNNLSAAIAATRRFDDQIKRSWRH